VEAGECPEKGNVQGLRGPAENPTLLSCDGGLLRTFRRQMRGFHDSFKEKPSYLFILLGLSLNSVASLIMRSLYLGLLQRTAVWCGAPSRYCAPSLPDNAIRVSGFGGEDGSVM
jgi:hypothetical protein